MLRTLRHGPGAVRAGAGRTMTAAKGPANYVRAGTDSWGGRTPETTSASSSRGKLRPRFFRKLDLLEFPRPSYDVGRNTTPDKVSFASIIIILMGDISYENLSDIKMLLFFCSIFVYF